MIDDRETAVRECAEIIASLAERGIVVDRFLELRVARPQYRAALPILWSGLRRANSSGAACELIWAIAGQASHPDEIRELIRFVKPFRGISFDLYTQLTYYRYLRGQGFQGRPPTEGELDEARYAVQSGWYRSYERPARRAPVRVDDPTFPDLETREIAAESEVRGMGLGNALLWWADPRLFDDITELLLDACLGFSRSLLPAALAKCDRHRAPEVLIKLLNDPDIGADAIEPLGKLKCQAARPYIERFLEHPIDRVRNWTVVALRRLDQAGAKRAPTRPLFEEVLPASERALGAKLTADQGQEPQDIKGKVSAFVIGALAEEERGWTRDHCVTTSVELEELDRTFRLLGRALHGDFSGKRGKLLREEIMAADHEDWKAYKLRVLVGGQDAEIWFHYFLDDVTTVDLAIWGPTAVVAAAKGALSRE
mgnify:CR=1 FL=1